MARTKQVQRKVTPKVAKTAHVDSRVQGLPLPGVVKEEGEFYTDNILCCMGCHPN